jgi:hypothetical protein
MRKIHILSKVNDGEGMGNVFTEISVFKKLDLQGIG